MPTIALALLGGALIATAFIVKVHRHKRKYGGVYRGEGPRVRVALRIYGVVLGISFLFSLIYFVATNDAI